MNALQRQILDTLEDRHFEFAESVAAGWSDRQWELWGAARERVLEIWPDLSETEAQYVAFLRVWPGPATLPGGAQEMRGAA